MIRTLYWLWPFWARHKGRVLLIASLGLAASALRVVNPLIIKGIIDGLKTDLTPERLIRDMLIILGVGLLHYLANLTAMSNRAWMNIRIEWEVRQLVFSHVTGLDQGFYRRYRTGDLMTRMLDDIHEKLSWFACSGVFRCLQSIFTFLAMLGAMFYVNPTLALWVLVPMPALLYLYIKVERELFKRYDALQKSISDIFDFLEACFTGVRVIKANSKEPCQLRMFGDRVEGQRNAEISSVKLEAFFWNFFQYAGFLSIALIFAAGGHQVIRGTATLGDLVAFQFFAFIMIWPLFNLSHFVVQEKRASVSIARLEELLRERSSVVEAKAPVRPDPAALALEFRDVHYRPGPEAADILKGVTFEARGGQRVALVGRIGSGKSLIMALVPRLMEATGGEILLGGTDIRKLGLAELRSWVAYVPQEPGIFSDTLLYNITFGEDVPRDRLARAIRDAQLDGDIANLPKGLDTVVGPRGTTLSGGQKQRVAIARALVRRPRILILDDCTSAVDAETEDRLWKALMSCLPDSLYLIITHRARTIADSDWIVTMSGGRAVETGTHRQLMRKDSLYREIYQRQRLEEEVRRLSEEG